MVRSYKRDAQGQFASGGSSGKAKSSKPSAKAAPKATAAKSSAGKTAAKPAAKSTASKGRAAGWAEKSGAFGERIGKALVSPERRELQRKKRIADEQLHRGIRKRDKEQGEDRPVDPFMPDRDLWNKRDKQRAAAKAEFQAARAARRGKKS